MENPTIKKVEADASSEAKVMVEFSPRVSRLFIFRPLWVIILIFPLMIYGIWADIMFTLNFFYMLILGRRHTYFFSVYHNIQSFIVRWTYYFGGYTDTRPSFWPAS